MRLSILIKRACKKVIFLTTISACLKALTKKLCIGMSVWFLLDLTQVVAKIRTISSSYTQFPNELILKCREGTTLVNIVHVLFHQTLDTEDTNANMEDERGVAFELHFLFEPDL
jgi:hypothetical protein